MKPVVIDALITGGCAVIAAIIGEIAAIYQSKKKKENDSDAENIDFFKVFSAFYF